jgi:hypothetical protein
MTDLTQLNNQQLWQQIADSLNELADRGVRITTSSDSSYIGLNYYGPYGFDKPGLCVVSDEADRWSVEDRTVPCAECSEPLSMPGTYCSARCRNAADRHDQDVEVDA